MKIAILGTRGVPNHYGGFEQFAEYLSKGLVEKGHEVTVYNSHVHPYQENEWKGVKISHQFDLEHKIGTVGQFVYDLNCILDSRSQGFDVILQLGYTSSSVWGKLLPKKSVIVTNMDGIEWKRTKFSRPVQKFLEKAEKWGVETSDYLISDSVGIQQHLRNRHGVDSEFIPYGAHLFESSNSECLAQYKLLEYKYDMLVARLEPENSIEEILDGYVLSDRKRPFLVIGKHETKYGEFLKEKYKEITSVNFLGGIYDIDVLNNLRHFSNLYFHGHTVGGTNPSLLEAMASSALICANENVFNQAILEGDALYFKNANQVASTLNSMVKIDHKQKISENRLKIKELYSWGRIVDDYEMFLLTCIEKGITR